MRVSKKPIMALFVVCTLNMFFGGLASAQQGPTIQMQCHDPASNGNFVGPDEIMINGMACRPVKQAAAQPATYAPAVPVAPATQRQDAGTSAPVTSASNSATPPQVTSVPLPAQAPAPNKSCLIVTSAEGHRMRNAIIAGVFTGGVGLVTGLVASGGRYEYRDAINIPPAQVKMKYKGDDLQKLQQQGVHIVVVRKNDKQGESEAIQNGRNACFPPAPSVSAQSVQ